MPIEVVCEIAAQVVTALEYMHLYGFVYRDLKPESKKEDPMVHHDLLLF